MAARVDWHRAGDGAVPRRIGGGNGMSRTGRIERKTSESEVLVELDLDGSGTTDISTGVPFYDHMLTALGKHSLMDLTVKAKGDIEIDSHHTVEDVAICIGEALKQAL